MIDVVALRAAVRELETAEQRQAAVALKCEEAGKQAADARAKRRDALERAALGLNVDLAKFRRGLDDAESAVTAYAAASDLAAKAVAEAERAISGVLRQHLVQREAAAQAALDTAHANFVEASRIRAVAAEAVAEAKRWNFDDHTLRNVFAKEIAKAGNEVAEKAA